jgi:hypothetical protein
VSQIRSDFRRDGFVVTGVLFTEPELVVLREAVTRVLTQCAEPVGWERWLGLVNQVRDPERWDPAFSSTRGDERLRDAAGDVLDAPAAVSWQHLVWRRPGCTLRLPWHSDLETWPEPARSIGGVALWLALDDSGPSAGGVRYAPGSQNGLSAAPPEPVCPVIPAGAALLHDGRTLHCSGPNTTDRWRRALVMVFTPRPSAPG